MLAESGAGEPRRQDVIIGDRTALGQAALAALLEQMGAVVVGRAGCAASLARLAAGWPNAVIVADLGLIGDEIAAPASARLIVIASDAVHAGLAGPAVEAAAGLVLRSSDADRLATCLAAVAAGGRWHDPAQGQRCLALARLTPRERDIVRLVARGARNRAIADSLTITEGTVKMHLHNIYAKLGLESRTQLATDQRLRPLQMMD